MPEEMNTTNGGGGMSEQSPAPEQAGEPKQGRSGKIVAIVVIILILAGAIYAWARRAPQGEETTGGAEQGAQTGQLVPGEGNVPETEVDASTADATGTTGTTGQAGATPETAAGGQESGAAAPTDQSVVITHTDSGYSPQTLTVKRGTTVTFKNESASQTWPASAVHPTHTAYPGSSLDKCGTAEQSTIFDACRGLNKGESWSFKFDNVGSWKYHDHLTPSHFGAIEVTE